MAETITNPILRGFYPDPSIVRVNDDYYIANSTFEWMPGVIFHHSKDLVNWELTGYALTSEKHINMSGIPSSGGVWAPCLTWCDGLFYLIFSNLRTIRGPYKDVHNYLTTAPSITGPWSEPIFLNSSGFDPSMFHDDNGKKWVTNMLWNHRYQDGRRFGGIILQEYDAKIKKLVGPIKKIFTGLAGFTEGPHIFKRNGYYYLMCAEGGTGLDHMVTLTRSKNIWGPYEVQPDNPIFTSKDKPEVELKKAGHGCLVDTQNGLWYMVHLCSRPVMPQNRSVLGRETAIQKVKWEEDGWLRLEAAGKDPLMQVPAPGLPSHPFQSKPARDNFDTRILNPQFNSLRAMPNENWLSLSERPGWLRMTGRESLGSKFEQSLVARRITSLNCYAKTCVEFEPDTYQQAAGLICYYDNFNFYYLKITHDEKLEKILTVCSNQNNKCTELFEHQIQLKQKNCHLKTEIKNEKMYFSYSLDGKEWEKINYEFNITTLSDEFCQDGCYTGAMVGICVQDLSGRNQKADFDYFEYQDGI